MKDPAGRTTLLEAKAANDDLYRKDGAVDQIKQIFQLKEGKDYEFGIATDGLPG